MPGLAGQGIAEFVADPTEIHMSNSAGSVPKLPQRYQCEFIQFARQRLRKFSLEQQMSIVEFRVQHPAARLDKRKTPAVRYRHAQREAQKRIDRHGRIDSLQQIVQPLAGHRRCKHGLIPAAVGILQRFQFHRRKAIDLIQHMQARPMVHSQFF